MLIQFRHRLLLSATALLPIAMASAVVASPAQAAPSITSTISGLSNPYAVAISADSATAYVPEYGSNSLAVIDIFSGQVTHIAIGSNTYPNAVALSPSGAFAYVSASGTSKVKEVNLSTGQVSQEWAAGSVPDSLAVSPDGQYVYAANNNGYSAAGRTVTQIKISTGATINAGDLGAGVDRIVLSPDGTRLYATIDGLPAVKALTVPGLTGGVTLTSAVTVPLAIARNASGSRIFVSSFGSGSLFALDSTTGANLGSFLTGGSPAALDVSSSAGVGVVGSTSTGALTLFDPETMTVLATLAGGSSPQSLAITPNGLTAVVANGNSNTVSIIDLGLAVQSSSGDAQLPADVYQAYATSAESLCQIEAPDSVVLPGLGAERRNEGWYRSYAEWPNGHSGGWVCERIIRYNAGTGRWAPVA